MRKQQDAILMLPSEVASALRFHPEYVRRLLRTGRIQAIKIGRSWRVPRAELDRILNVREIPLRPVSGDNQDLTL